jgi:hypothetical protein
MRLQPLICAAIAIAVSGCLTTERVGRPPSPADIARINDAASHGSLSVLSTPYAAPELPASPRCAGGGCDQPSWARGRPAPVAIATADARPLTHVLADGGRADVPMQAVAAVDVSGTRRAELAGVGAGVGAATMFGLAGMAYLVGHMEPSAGGCDATCASAFAIATVGGAAVGALIGAIGGNTHRFSF